VHILDYGTNAMTTSNCLVLVPQDCLFVTQDDEGMTQNDATMTQE
jgi:hypothetical protein